MRATQSRQARSLATKFTELAFAVPQVVAHRVTRMAIAGSAPSARDRAEFKLMGSEKTNAFFQSWNAMTTHTFLANQALASSMCLAMWSPLVSRKKSSAAAAAKAQDAMLGILGKGLDPIHRTAVANAKRLGRTRLR